MGEMSDEGLPQYVEDYDDPDDPWDHFVEDHVPLSWDSWLADTRSSVPLIPELWGQVKAIETWRDLRPESDYRWPAGLDNGQHAEIVVAGHIDVNQYDRHGTYRIESALVSPGTARSFALSVSGANRHDFVFPVEIDEFSKPRRRTRRKKTSGGRQSNPS